MSTCCITGANRGIGLELTRRLTQRGDRVFALCRSASPELESTGATVLDRLDVTDPDAIAALPRRLGGETIDLLINNAGVLSSETLRDLDVDRIRRQFEVNALGPLRVTAALLDALAPRAKVVMITSRMGSIADNSSGGYYGYRMSKAALNAAAVSLARDLQARGLTVLILHPGMVATEMTGHSGIDVAESVTGLLERIDTLGPESTATFHHQSGEPLPW